MKKLFELIPADDLHWSEEDNKFVVLSFEERDKIITTYINGLLDPSQVNMHDLMEIIRNFEYMKITALLMKRFFNDNLSFMYDVEQKMFLWTAKDE